MKTVITKWMKALVVGCAAILLISCNDSNEPGGKGNVQFEITDGPADDADVQGVYVTITDIKVEGKSIGNVAKTTIDLKEYTEGVTKVLAVVNQFDAKNYGNITLVLDLNTDMNGNTPGCYVQTFDGTRNKLRNTSDGSAEITVTKNFEVATSTTSKVVLDFDIRKAIAYDATGESHYRFITDNQLNTTINVVNKEKTGMIKGVLNDYIPGDNEKVIAYAYRKGTFSASTETQPQGDNQIYFMNAVASAEVKPGLSGRSYVIAFMEAGDYELYFASYSQSFTARSLFQNVLQAELNVGGIVGNKITVQAGGTVSVATMITSPPEGWPNL